MLRSWTVLGVCLLALGGLASPVSAASTDCAIFVHGTAKESGSANWSQESSNFFNLDHSRESHTTVASGGDGSSNRMYASGSPVFSGSVGSNHSYSSSAAMLASFL